MVSSCGLWLRCKQYFKANATATVLLGRDASLTAVPSHPPSRPAKSRWGSGPKFLRVHLFGHVVTENGHVESLIAILSLFVFVSHAFFPRPETSPSGVATCILSQLFILRIFVQQDMGLVLAQNSLNTSWPGRSDPSASMKAM